MAASKGDIREWLSEKEDYRGKVVTHLIVCCDTFNWDDFPVYVTKGEDAMKRVEELKEQSMTKVMEVYSYAKDIEEQLAQHRAFNF